MQVMKTAKAERSTGTRVQPPLRTSSRNEPTSEVTVKQEEC